LGKSHFWHFNATESQVRYPATLPTAVRPGHGPSVRFIIYLLFII